MEYLIAIIIGIVLQYLIIRVAVVDAILAADRKRDKRAREGRER